MTEILNLVWILIKVCHLLLFLWLELVIKVTKYQYVLGSSRCFVKFSWQLYFYSFTEVNVRVMFEWLDGTFLKLEVVKWAFT